MIVYNIKRRWSRLKMLFERRRLQLLGDVSDEIRRAIGIKYRMAIPRGFIIRKIGTTYFITNEHDWMVIAYPDSDARGQLAIEDMVFVPIEKVRNTIRNAEDGWMSVSVTHVHPL